MDVPAQIPTLPPLLAFLRYMEILPGLKEGDEPAGEETRRVPVSLAGSLMRARTAGFTPVTNMPPTNSRC